MGAANWIEGNWFDLLQTVCIVGSFLMAAYALRRDEKARKISNSIAIADQYRKIWSGFVEHPHLARVLEPRADLEKEPVSVAEETFVTTLIGHLSTVLRAMGRGEFVELEGLRRDVHDFFKLPIPKAVWRKWKPVQDKAFVAFVESCVGVEASTS